MEPRTLPPPTSVAANSSSTKLRLMCSYGGQITPQPHTKSLCYAGGDTRIVGIPTATANANANANSNANANTNALTLSSLIAHVATTLNIQYPFTLKYQLPHEDLDSLISLSADEDLHIMLEEYDRLTSSHAPSRIRLFLFPIKLPPVRPESTLPDLAQSVLQQKAVEGDWFRAELGRDELAQPVLQHPRTEAWFVDALRTARMMKGGLEGQSEGSDGCGGGGVCGQESIVLETSSSFGSSSSSVSLSNLPPIKGHGDDNVANLLDNKTKLPSPELVASDNNVATDISYGQTGVYQQQVIPFHAMESKVSTNPFETDTKLPDPPSAVHMNKVVMVPGYPLSPSVDQSQQQVQIIHSGTHYIPQSPAGMLPVSSYYPMYHPQPPQQPHYQFQPTQPYPIYYIPVGQSQPYSFPIRHGLVDASNIVSAQPYVHPIVPLNTIIQVASKEVTSAPHVPELTSQVYPTGQAANPLVHVPFNETLQQPLSLPQIHHQPQTVSVAPRETFNYSNELDEDTARAQIYKSQPPGPALPSQFQTMTKATTVLLSEALAQFHTDNIQQQIKTSEPH